MKQSTLKWKVLSVILVAAIVFLLLERKPQVMETAPHSPSQAVPPVLSQSKPAVPEASRPTTQKPAVKSPPPLQEVPESVRKVLALRLLKVMNDQAAAKEALEKLDYLHEDPDGIRSELAYVAKEKRKTLETPLMFLTLSQALEDPDLKPLLLEQWKTSGSAMAAALDSVVLNLANWHGTPSPSDPNALAARFQELEPRFQAKYEKLIETLQIGEAEARLIEQWKAAENMYPYIGWYMQRRGWRFDQQSRSFVPSNP